MKANATSDNGFALFALNMCLSVNSPVGGPPSRPLVRFRGASVFCGTDRGSVGWGKALRGLMLCYKLQRPKHHAQSGYYY